MYFSHLHLARLTQLLLPHMASCLSPLHLTPPSLALISPPFPSPTPVLPSLTHSPLLTYAPSLPLLSPLHLSLTPTPGRISLSRLSSTFQPPPSPIPRQRNSFTNQDHLSFNPPLQFPSVYTTTCLFPSLTPQRRTNGTIRTTNTPVSASSWEKEQRR